MIRIVTKWKARRSGSCLAIDGIDPDTGRPVTVTGVEEIVGADPHPHATGNIREQGRSTVTLRGN